MQRLAIHYNNHGMNYFLPGSLLSGSTPHIVFNVQQWNIKSLNSYVDD